MTRQVNKPTQFIKPAVPKPDTWNKIKMNTFNWMKNNMDILHEHYTHIIIDIMERIPKFGELEWAVAVR